MGILDLFSLKGKNALVTGSDHPLGADMAIAFAQAGANVTLHNYDAVQRRNHRGSQEDRRHATSTRSGDVCDEAIRQNAGGRHR